MIIIIGCIYIVVLIVVLALCKAASRGDRYLESLEERELENKDIKENE